MIEAFRYLTPQSLRLDYSLSPNEVIVLPEPATKRLASILSRYNRKIPEWNSEQAFYVSKHRNFPFATIYFDREYPLGGHITSSRWDRYESPYQAFTIPPQVDLGYAGCWWFRTKERLHYAALRSPLAAQVWELLKDKDGSSPWAVFMDPLDPGWVETTGKLNLHLDELRRMDADLETIFPFNGEELDSERDKVLISEAHGKTVWYTNPYAFEKLEKILKLYQTNVEFLIVYISRIYNTDRIHPWLTVCLNREHDLVEYFSFGCRFKGDEFNALSYTIDFHLTPEEFGHHFPFGILYFKTKKHLQYCVEKSSLIASWWEKVKDLRDDRGWMLVPPDDLTEYEESDIFAVKRISDSQ